MNNEENVKRIDVLLVHDRMVDNDLELYLYLNNEDYDVPKNWYSTNEFMELMLHFSIPKIFDSMYSDCCCPMPGKGSAVLIDNKDRFDALKAQLEEVIADINSIEYITEKEYKEAHSRFQKLSNEEINEVIAKSEITLKNFCSDDKQTEFARAIEAKLREKNL